MRETELKEPIDVVILHCAAEILCFFVYASAMACATISTTILATILATICATICATISATILATFFYEPATISATIYFRIVLYRFALLKNCSKNRNTILSLPI